MDNEVNSYIPHCTLCKVKKEKDAIEFIQK